MVLGVCRRVLRNEADAADAFQATFLVLVRKAAGLRSPAGLGSWLYGVAYRAASEVRKAAARRRAREARAMPRVQTTCETATELREVLDQELAGLPEKYRSAVVLCDLEGKTYKEAAAGLSCAEGTVASRLARGRALLARRLSRHGLTLSAGGVTALMSQEAAAGGVPAALVVSTVKAALSVAAGQAVAAPVAAVMEGVLKAMLLHKLRLVAGALVVLALLAAGTGLVLPASQPAGEEGPEGGGRGPARKAKEAVAAMWAGAVGDGYRNNDAYADELAGKQVQVTGQMNQVKRLGNPTSYVLTMLAGGPYAKDNLLLTFAFATEARKQLASLRSNQVVTVEGRCEGKVKAQGGGETILFRDCRIVRVEPVPAPVRIEEQGQYGPLGPGSGPPAGAGGKSPGGRTTPGGKGIPR
jgi:RNA polymerase sigma factor (sigma-70 family)